MNGGQSDLECSIWIPQAKNPEYLRITTTSFGAKEKVRPKMPIETTKEPYVTRNEANGQVTLKPNEYESPHLQPPISLYSGDLRIHVFYSDSPAESGGTLHPCLKTWTSR